MPLFFRPFHAALAAALLLLGLTPGSAQNAPTQPLDVGALKKSGKPPRAIKHDPPVYPFQMARAGLIGSVKIAFIIDTDGSVRNPYVVESNNPWFERPAVDAILGWKFQPAEMNGRRVTTRVMQQIDFNLDPGGELPWRITKGKNHAKLPPDLQWDTAPIPVRTTYPVFPYAQLKTGVSGKALITYQVGTNGAVVGAKLDEATTPEFGRAVLAMIDTWRFQPGRKKDGTPAGAILHAEYEFRPDGRGDVPVTDGARGILRTLEKKPESIATGSDLDGALQPLSRQPPVYPTALAQAGQPGRAVIEFFVDKNGDAQLPRIVSSSAPEFGYAASQAVATWRFSPPLVKKKPAVIRVQVPVEFKL